MNVAVIIAGGNGSRMGQDIPKQFINVYDKPVIIYTLESFQKHPEIDAILAVCIDGWHDVLWAYAKQFGIDKLKWVVSNGATAQESIRNGLLGLKDICQEGDIVIIIAYAQMDEKEAKALEPKVVLVDKRNHIVKNFEEKAGHTV